MSARIWVIRPRRTGAVSVARHCAVELVIFAGTQGEVSQACAEKNREIAGFACWRIARNARMVGKG
jgi:hypothetical protein